MLRKVRRLHSSALTYFMAVCEAGSFRGASRQLGIAASAINRHVILLEDELEVQLFERTGSELKLTAAGEIVRRHCSETIRSFERVSETIDALRGIHTGIVRIAASESLAADFLPRLCSDFARRYPDVELRISVSNSAGVIARVEADEVDVGFAFGFSDLRPEIVHAGFDLPIGAIVGAEHPFAGKSSITLAECFTCPIVLPEPSLSFRLRLEEISDLFARPAHRGIVAGSPRLMVGLAKQNTHLAFMTPLGPGDEIARGDLRFLPITDPGLKPDRCVILSSFGTAERFAAQRLLALSETALAARVAESVALALGTGRADAQQS